MEIRFQKSWLRWTKIKTIAILKRKTRRVDYKTYVLPSIYGEEEAIKIEGAVRLQERREETVSGFLETNQTISEMIIHILSLFFI